LNLSDNEILINNSKKEENNNKLNPKIKMNEYFIFNEFIDLTLRFRPKIDKYDWSEIISFYQ